MTGPTARPWWRCVTPPCQGDRRTDGTWAAHWRAAHPDAYVRPRRPFVDMSHPAATGKDLAANRALAAREAYRVEREELRRRNAGG